MGDGATRIWLVGDPARPKPPPPGEDWKAMTTREALDALSGPARLEQVVLGGDPVGLQVLRVWRGVLWRRGR